MPPGQLQFHYAPKVPIHFIDSVNLDKLKSKKIGALFFNENNYEFPFVSVKILSETSNLQEAASNLFSYLHEFENENIDLILCEKLKNKGLGRAIMDRLSKAVRKFAKE